MSIQEEFRVRPSDASADPWIERRLWLMRVLRSATNIDDS